MRRKYILCFAAALLLVLLSGCSASSVSGEDIVDCAVQYIGNPYEWKGASLMKGCDSSGFVAGVLAEVGIIPEESADAHVYNVEELSSIGKEVPTDEVKEGDILIYEKMAAFYIDEERIIYAKSIKDGILIEKTDPINSFGGVVTIRRVSEE